MYISMHTPEEMRTIPREAFNTLGVLLMVKLVQPPICIE